MENEAVQLYQRKGQASGPVGNFILLIIGIGVGTLILIFVSALGGQTYNLVEPDINGISNSSIRGAVTNASYYGFRALETTGKYMPVYALAIIIFIILSLVMGLGGMAGGGRGGGAVL